MRIHQAGLWLIIVAAFTAGSDSGAQTARPDPHAGDPWIGTYGLRWIEGSAAAGDAGPSHATLRKAADADPATVPPGEGTDPARWSLGGSADESGGVMLRRFTPREYRDLNWTALHAAGTIDCLSSISMFICRTAPGALVTMGQEESGGGEITPTRTGMFGVALHAGAFELEKVAEAATDPRLGLQARDPLAISAEEIEGERADEVSRCLDTAINSNTMGACVNAELDRQDARLNEVYRAVMKRLDDAGKGRLRSEELAWIRERDAGCQEEMMGGTGDMYEWPNCLLNETARRRLVLESMLRS